jgi:CheY-like chemotaxis protein
MGDMKTAIVIDDCEPIRVLIRKLLQNFGYEVQDFPAPSDHICTHFYTENPCDSKKPCCDLLITDHNMPGFTNGIDFLKQQHQRICKIPKVAIISGTWDDDAKAEVEKMGIKSFNKPFDLAEFTEWATS